MGHWYTKLLNNGSYPAPFSLDSGYGPEFPDSGFDILLIKRLPVLLKRCLEGSTVDVNVVADDIRNRAQLDKKEEEPQQESVPGFLQCSRSSKIL